MAMLGPYAIEGEIGRGGVGVVLRGRAPDGRAVALKLLLRADARVGLDRFEREWRIQADLGEAAGFVPLLDVGESARGPYLVMPFLAGGTLRERLRSGALPIDEAVRMTAAIAAAIGRAHQAGVVHRDLKPENVLFTVAGRPLVADLGLAKHFSETVPGASRSVSLSRSGMFAGTVGYMAPEQMSDAKSAGPPADVFALGAILFECLAGRPAFVADSALEVARRAARGEHPSLRRLRPDLSKGLIDLVGRALAVDPTMRPPHGMAFFEALELAAREAPRRPAARRASAAIVAIVAGLVVVTAAVVARRRSDPAGSSDAARVVPSGPDSARDPAAAILSHVWEAIDPEIRARIRGSWGEMIRVGAPCLFVRRVLGGSVLAVFLNGELRLWRDDGNLEPLGVHPDVVAAAVSPDGTWGATAGGGAIRLWSFEPGAPASEPTSLSLEVPRALVVLEASADRQVVLVGGEGGLVRVDLAARPDAAESVDAEGALRGTHALVPTRSPGHVLVGLAAGRLALCDATAGRVLRTFELGSDLPIIRLAVSPDGARAFAWDGRSLATVDLADGEVVDSRELEKATLVVGFARDGADAIACTKKTIQTISLSGATPRVSPPTDLPRSGFGFGDLDVEDGGDRVILGGGHVLHLWDARRRQSERSVPVRVANARSVAIAADGSHVAVGFFDGQVGIIDRRSGRERRLFGHPDAVPSVAFTPDGATVLTASWDGTAGVRDLVSGEVRVRLRGHDDRLNSIAALADGTRAVTGSYDRTARVWDIRTGVELARLEGHAGPVFTVGAVAGAERVLTASTDGARLFDLASGRVIQIFAPGERILAVAASPDGRRAALGGADGGLRLVDLDALTEIDGIPDAHEQPVFTVAWSGDGRHVLSMSVDGTARVSRAGPDRLEEHEQTSLAELGFPMSGAFLPARAGEDGPPGWIIGTSVGVVVELAPR